MVVLTANPGEYQELKFRIAPEFIENTRKGKADNIFYRVAYDDDSQQILFRDGYRDAQALIDHVTVDTIAQLMDAGMRSAAKLWFIGPKEQLDIVRVTPGLDSSTFWELDQRSVIFNPYPGRPRPNNPQLGRIIRATAGQ